MADEQETIIDDGVEIIQTGAESTEDVETANKEQSSKPSSEDLNWKPSNIGAEDEIAAENIQVIDVDSPSSHNEAEASQANDELQEELEK